MFIRVAKAFDRAQKAASDAGVFWVGHHLTVAAMTLAVLAWCASGLLVGFTREWLLISNIAGTLGAVLILLLVQHARTRHTLAIHAKLDELILSSEAKNQWIGAERHPPEIVKEMRLKHHDNTG